MLSNRYQNDRTYEELITEALMQIPFYSGEWTNHLPSDPGITILENLTAFEVLQQNRIHEITPQVMKMLLKLVGFEAGKGRCARVLLAAENLREPLALPANQPFRLGALCYETNRSIRLPACRLTGVYSVREGRKQDLSYLLNREVQVPAPVFGERPAEGFCLWITSDGLPEPGEEMIFYVTVADRHNRNPFGEKQDHTFAEIRWECYTDQGFVPMHVRDETGGLLVSGELRMRLPGERAVPCREAPDGQYAIRATLIRADYDVRPRLVQMDGFLLEAWQKETLSACYTFNRVVSASLPGRLLGDGYVMVFCKEEKGSSYRKYEPCPAPGEKGRYYEAQEGEDGLVTWYFDRRRFGYGPAKVKNAIKIVVYQEEIMRRFSLGTVLGCDHQGIRLPAGHVVPESFCIIAKRTDAEGVPLYDFVRPGRYGENDLSYDLYENDGLLMIEDAGDYIGAKLYMGTFSVTEGAEGNIRRGNFFTAPGVPSSVRFYNPKPGTGGRHRETLTEVKRRFLADLKKPFVAVTAKDYEELVKGTPKLCIKKVRACMSGSGNLVRIAVMPGTDEPFPGLSEAYRRAIERRLEERRLLTTRIEIVPPAYTPIDVRGVIYVKRQYENSLEQIEEAIRRKMDYIHSDRNFGDTLKFDEIFHEIESLDCVEFIYELSLYPQNPGLAKLVEADIVPNENCLCYAGNIILQTE